MYYVRCFRNEMDLHLSEPTHRCQIDIGNGELLLHLSLQFSSLVSLPITDPPL